MIKVLMAGEYTVKELSTRFKITQKQVREELKAMKLRGILLKKVGPKWTILRTPPVNEGASHIYSSEKNNTFTFGFLGDTHLCSKYERLDVLNNLYDIFELEGIKRVYHTGNWIEGEAPFNKYDLKSHGLDDQCDYFVENYPIKNDMVTYAVAGDDHEGWWGKREGIDIGSHLEGVMQYAGRRDWKNLGFMESFVTLKNANTKKTTEMLIMHPGGGSSYATSYRPQKIVESFAGGEKPAVLLIGHYHKLSYNIIRNVHAIQTGCTQDQTPFMRKKGIDAHVGGGICKLRQDPKTGAIYSCRIEFFHYFNKGHYNNRWNYRGQVNLPERNV